MARSASDEKHRPPVSRDRAGDQPRDRRLRRRRRVHGRHQAGDVYPGRRPGRVRQLRRVPPAVGVGPVQPDDLRGGRGTGRADRRRHDQTRHATLASGTRSRRVPGRTTADRRRDRDARPVDPRRRTRRRPGSPPDSPRAERRLASRRARPGRHTGRDVYRATRRRGRVSQLRHPDPCHSDPLCSNVGAAPGQPQNRPPRDHGGRRDPIVAPA